MAADITPSVALELPPPAHRHEQLGIEWASWSADQMRAYAQRAVEAATRELRDDRDSWIEQNSARMADALKYAEEAAALRRDLEALRKASLAAHNSIDEDGRNEPEMVALRDVLTASGPAREGLSPLTWNKLNELARQAQINFCLDKVSSFELGFARAIEAAHGIAAPAGTGEGEKA